MSNSKASIWTRLTWLFRGKPVSHEEAKAARFRPTNDPMTQIQGQTRGIGTSGMRL